MGCVLCEHCTALCCKYFALPIETPTSAEDFDDIRWYLMHENVAIFVEKQNWYINFTSRCRNLRRDNRCAVYATRPRICREYTTDNCDYHDGEYEHDVLFTSPEQIEAYAKDYLSRNGGKGGKRKAGASKKRTGRVGKRPLVWDLPR